MAFLRLIRIGGSSRARGRVVLYVNQMTWIAGNEPISAFDYNGNGRIDVAGVARLFNLL